MMLTPFTIVLWGTTAGMITTEPGPTAEETIAANTSQPPCTPWAVGSSATTPGSVIKQFETLVQTVRGLELKLVYVEQGRGNRSGNGAGVRVFTTNLKNSRSARPCFLCAVI